MKMKCVRCSRPTDEARGVSIGERLYCGGHCLSIDQIERGAELLAAVAPQLDRGPQVGDLVRSFDFPLGSKIGRDLTGGRASFVVGRVLSIADAPGCVAGCDHYHVKVSASMIHGVADQDRVGIMVYPPVEGRGGVEVIEGH